MFIIPTVTNFDSLAAQLFYMPLFHLVRDVILNVQGVFFQMVTERLHVERALDGRSAQIVSFVL